MRVVTLLLALLIVMSWRNKTCVSSPERTGLRWQCANTYREPFDSLLLSVSASCEQGQRHQWDSAPQHECKSFSKYFVAWHCVRCRSINCSKDCLCWVWSNSHEKLTSCSLKNKHLLKFQKTQIDRLWREKDYSQQILWSADAVDSLEVICTLTWSAFIELKKKLAWPR